MNKNIEKQNKEILSCVNNLKAAKKDFSETLAKFKESKAHSHSVEDSQMTNSDIRDFVYNEMDYVYRSINNMYAAMDDLGALFYDYTYQHSKGHLPQIKSTSQMTEALKTLGLGDDYEVYKPLLTVANKNEFIIG